MPGIGPGPPKVHHKIGEQPRVLQDCTLAETNIRGRNRQRIRYIDQSEIPITEAKSIRIDEIIPGRVNCPARLNGLELNSIMDSGNTFRTCASLELMKKLGLTEDDLQPISQKSVGSAILQDNLTILGETRTAVTL